MAILDALALHLCPRRCFLSTGGVGLAWRYEYCEKHFSLDHFTIPSLRNLEIGRSLLKKSLMDGHI
jgi:hypothetical protein